MRTSAVCTAVLVATLAFGRVARPGQPIPEPVTNSVGMVLVPLPAGEFRMGQWNEVVDVTLTRPFMIGRTEVTRGQWRRVMGTEPWKQAGNPLKGGDDYPVVLVSWADANAFCEKLTALEQRAGTIRKGVTYGLPTEAQWEYACRAGTTTHFSCGDDTDCLDECAWWGGLFGDGNTRAEPYPHAVAAKQPNAWGLFDMHGNVSEWCSDIIAGQLQGGTDPVGPQLTGPQEGFARVVRGGAWHNHPALCRSGHRDADYPAANVSIGFRVVRTIPP